MKAFDRLMQAYGDFFKNYDRYKRFINFFGNVILFVLAVYIISDIQGFKDSYLCKAYKPVVDAAQQCTYGVRQDLCYWPWPAYNFSLPNETKPWNQLIVGKNWTPPTG